MVKLRHTLIMKYHAIIKKNVKALYKRGRKATCKPFVLKINGKRIYAYVYMRIKG